MTKKNTPESEQEKPEKKGKLKSILLRSIGAAFLISTGVGGGVYYAETLAQSGPKQDPNRPMLVKRGDNPPGDAAASDDKEAPLKDGSVYVENDRVKVDPSKFEVTYYKLPESFTANLGDGANFIQLGISLSTYYDGRVITNAKRQMVPLRSTILLVLSEQAPEEIATAAGKRDLQKKLTDAINTVLRDKEGFGGIDNVYFTDLVIQ